MTTSFSHFGHRASTDQNILSGDGFVTAVELRPDVPLRVHYTFGLTAIPSGFGRAATIDAVSDGIRLTAAFDRDVFAAADLQRVVGND